MLEEKAFLATINQIVALSLRTYGMTVSIIITCFGDKMNILITGFSGNLGAAVVELFAKQGHQLRVLLHGSAFYAKEFGLDVEIVWGGLSDHYLFDQLTSGIDAVVHCAWEGRGASDGLLEQVNLGGTMALIDAAERNNVKTFVHISSVGVYGINRSLWGQELNEKSPMVSKEDSLNPYPWVKVLIEKKIEEIYSQLKMNMVIIRPGLLFSESKAPAKKLIGSKRKRRGLFVGRAKNHLPYIHVDDVAAMISKLIDKPVKYNIYNCVPTIKLSASDFFKKWGKSKGYSVGILRMPPIMLRFMMWGVRKLKKAMGKKSGSPSIDYQIATGTRNIMYSADKAINEIGWQDTITKTIAEQA